jgi:arsenite methyltransferase
MSATNIQKVVQEKYGAAAKRVTVGKTSCCADGADLSGDKDRVVGEAFRVLKPGGRFAVSDVVVRGEVPADVRKSMELWVGGMAGALQESEYLQKLQAAGFTSMEVQPTRVYHAEESREFLAAAGLDPDRVAPLIDGKFISAFIRATRPAAAACCGPTRCG